MKAWVAESHGRPLDVLALHEVEEPVAGSGQVVVKVHAATVNMQEVDMIYGRYATLPEPAPFVPGAEVLGTVESAGPGAEGWLGRRVVGMPRGVKGGYAERALLPTDMVFDAPDLPDVEAAAVFWPFHVAWFCLFERGQTRRDETVLVHAAAGGVGSMALQLAVHTGARVIATAGSDEKVRACRELGAEHAVNYEKEDFLDAVLEITGGRGVDVAFDTVGGPVMPKTWQCMALGGRYLMVGLSSGIEQEDEPTTLRPIFTRNISVIASLITYAHEPRPLSRNTIFSLPPREVGDRIHDRLLSLLERGRVRPVVGLDVPFEKLPEAVDAFERRRVVGRAVITVP